MSSFLNAMDVGASGVRNWVGWDRFSRRARTKGRGEDHYHGVCTSVPRNPNTVVIDVDQLS
jgi:hypothetical protein